VGIDVVNPLNVPLVLTEVGRWVGWKGEGIICSGGVLLIWLFFFAVRQMQVMATFEEDGKAPQQQQQQQQHKEERMVDVEAQEVQLEAKVRVSIITA